MRTYDLFLVKCLRVINFLWKKSNPRSHDPRLWSNDQLMKFTHIFDGDVINISAGDDQDKDGKRYKDYFINARSYSTSNYCVENQHGGDYIFDLSTSLKNHDPFERKFDVVFSHTVLEHVDDIETAVENLCHLSVDVIITVVPFIQSFHGRRGEYADYWRFSPLCLSSLFGKHGFESVSIAWSDDPIGNIYILHVSSCNLENWIGKVESSFVDRAEGPGYFRNKIVHNLDFCKNVIINLDNK